MTTPCAPADSTLNRLAGLYEAARSIVPRERLLAVRDAATAASLAEVLAGIDPTEVADLLADATEQAIVAALGGRLDQVCARLASWSERCIRAGAFPADILKRAAG